jgi:hypothetical protein
MSLFESAALLKVRSSDAITWTLSFWSRFIDPGPLFVLTLSPIISVSFSHSKPGDKIYVGDLTTANFRKVLRAILLQGILWGLETQNVGIAGHEVHVSIDAPQQC